MNKILLILKREYISRVKKKSFLLATFLMPILIGSLYALSIYLSIKKSDDKFLIKIIDENGYIGSQIENKGVTKFEMATGKLDTVKKSIEDGEGFALLYIPKIDLYNPKGIELYTIQTPGLDLTHDIDNAVEDALESIKMEKLGLNQNTLDSIKTRVSIKSKSLSGKTSATGNSTIAMAIGTASGFLIYMFIMIYGAQVMRAIMQEKMSKIVEILISSVKPYQLMMGKILGVALVGLTQFSLWIILTFFILSIGPMLINIDPQIATNAANGINIAGNTGGNIQALETINKLNDVLGKINIPLILGAFLYFFLTGYLFNAALFAMIGSAVDSEADTQQFMMPIMMPIIVSMMMLVPVLKNPGGDLAFWLSMIPFSAPIIMMVRLPFDVPTWQLILSMLIMILGFIGTTWMAGRVYRIGILMHGSKVNYKVIFKWMMSRE